MNHLWGLCQGYQSNIICQVSTKNNATATVFRCLQGVDIQAILDDMRKLKIIAKGHERRIKFLEERLAAYEDAHSGGVDGHNDDEMAWTDTDYGTIVLR